MFDLLGITFHWYGLLIGLAIVVATEVAIAQKKIDEKTVEKSLWWIVAGGVAGARAYHVIDYWEYYSQDLVKILYMWEGGLGIWGALVGGTIGLLVYCYFNKLNFWQLIDVYIVGLPLAQAIGRIGNYVNGELYGKNGEPLFAYEGILNLFLFAILWKSARGKHHKGFVTGLYLAGYGLIRVALENMRPDHEIWRMGTVPTAVLFGIAGIVIGGYLIFQKRS